MLAAFAERRREAVILRKSFFNQELEASYLLAGKDDAAGVDDPVIPELTLKN